MSSPPNRNILSTSSPEGIQVASKITPTRLANLLIRHGPLPIRHITAQLSIEVPGFEMLSLSKQRRLIMGAMEQKDSVNDVVFEKIGWGQWAVRHAGSDYIVTEGTESTGKPSSAAASEKPAPLSVQELRNQTGLKLGWSKKQAPRRESITNAKNNLHNLKVPNESVMESSAIASDSEDEDDPMEGLDDDSESSSESDNELFVFDNDYDAKFKRSPPIKFADRVPFKVTSPPPGLANRRKSSSANPNSVHKYRHTIFNRSRLNSLENLDNYILSSGKNSTTSFNSPPPLSASPINSLGLNYAHHTINTSPESIEAAMSAAGRRKSSFNESHIRSTLSSSLPKHLQPPEIIKKQPYENRTVSQSTSVIASAANNDRADPSDTDEEDWATIGAETLRKPRTSTKKPISEERAAANALVDLMSV